MTNKFDAWLKAKVQIEHEDYYFSSGPCHDEKGSFISGAQAAKEFYEPVIRELYETVVELVNSSTTTARIYTALEKAKEVLND